MLGYRLYGSRIARLYQPDDSRETPATRYQDGIDFVPTKRSYLLGQHFSAIAAAGPIAGPILACQQFGWFPCLLWIVLGVIFIGAVHDFSSLITSLRHDAKSVAEVVKENIGNRAWFLILIFIWILLVYVIVAFTDITAATFVGRIEELEGIPVSFERGGAVAASSILYLLLALFMGVIQRKWSPPLWILTMIFVPSALAAVWCGTYLGSYFLLPQKTWGFLILGYCLVASLLPIWLLLQPRGYLGGFILYLALAIGLIGIFFGNYEIHQDFFKTWKAPGMTGSLFPFLFVTIACGACSGFHALVCSGTTVKQIARESDCRPVGYGGMLLEAFVALIALSTIMILPPGEVHGSPGAIYGAGIGRFLTILIGPENLLFAITFGAMAFSTFVFDTLDVATRLGRYILQELVGKRTWGTAILATTATTLVPAFFLFAAKKGGWSSFWILFGTANQLLAGLTLSVIGVWLYRSGKKSLRITLPALFLMGITFWSLIRQILSIILQIRTSSLTSVAAINGIVALVLMGLAVSILWNCKKSLRNRANVPSLPTS